MTESLVARQSRPCIRHWDIAPRILDLGTKCKWVVSFRPWPLYYRRKAPSVPNESEAESFGTGTANGSFVLVSYERWTQASVEWQEAGEKPAVVLLCSSQITHRLRWDWTRVPAIRSRRLIAWVVSRPVHKRYRVANILLVKCVTFYANLK